jgi:SRSO17 transposase
MFGHFFRTQGKSLETSARAYLQGLLTAGPKQKNIEDIATHEGYNYDSLHHAVSQSDWNEKGLMLELATQASGAIGGHPDSALIIDECGFAKQGKNSVGVSRQWNGRLGKTDNCQVAVFAVLAAGNGLHVPIGKALFLPESWTMDSDRMKKAGVPIEKQSFQDKKQLAEQLIDEATQNQVAFGWVGFDAFYGRDSQLLARLEDKGLIFMGDVPKSQSIWEEAPIITSRQKLNRGRRKPLTDGEVASDVVLEASAPKIIVSELTSKLAPELWSKRMIRHGSRGPIEVYAYCQLVWTWDGRESAPRCRWLVATCEHLGGEIKHSLSNASEETNLDRLIFMQNHRYWVERAFEDGKGEVGMADYQVRKWMGWHHHMAIVMLAMLFILKEKMLSAQIELDSADTETSESNENEEEDDEDKDDENRQAETNQVIERSPPDRHLTPAQITRLLAFYLPSRAPVTEERLIRRIQFERRRQRVTTRSKIKAKISSDSGF